MDLVENFKNKGCNSKYRVKKGVGFSKSKMKQHVQTKNNGKKSNQEPKTTNKHCERSELSQTEIERYKIT